MCIYLEQAVKIVVSDVRNENKMEVIYNVKKSSRVASEAAPEKKNKK